MATKNGPWQQKTTKNGKRSTDAVIARELYDYRLALPEARNLVGDHPDMVAALSERLQAGP